MIQKFYKFSFLIILTTSIFSCNKNPFDVKLKEHIKVKEVRFDQELMRVDTSKINEAINLFYQKYPIFFPTYTYGVIKVGGKETRTFAHELKRFISDPTMRKVNSEIQEKFSDVSDITEDINNALSYYHYYFPKESIPTLYYIQSGFNQRIIVDSLVLGVALDMCLGANSDYYVQLGLPNYMSAKLNKDNIALDVMRGLAWSNFSFDGKDDLASNIIYEGKIQYLMDALFPNKSDAEKLSYSDTQMKWLSKHESDVWEAVLQEEMLYKTDRMKIKNMIENAPFTQAFGNDSPPKIGVWLGWKIVKSYMASHPEISLPDLMMNKDYIGILNDSNY